MIPGINPKQMERVMKQMGIQSEEIDAEEVIIKTSEKTIKIINPQVTKIRMQGQDSFQITGEVTEEKAKPYSEEDIKFIMEKTKVSEGKAIEALELADGDVAKAIMDLSKEE